MSVTDRNPSAAKWAGLCLVLLVLVTGACRTPRTTVGFGEPATDIAATQSGAPLAFHGADVDVVKEGNGLSRHDRVQVRTTVTDTLRKAYGPSRADADRVPVKVKLSTPDVDYFAMGFAPVLPLTVELESVLPDGRRITTSHDGTVDEDSVFGDAIMLPSIIAWGALTLGMTAIGIVLVALAPPVGLAALTANALVAVPGGLILAGVHVWSMFRHADVRIAAATAVLVEAVELHARDLAAATRSGSTGLARADGDGEPAPVGAAGRGALEIALYDDTGCIAEDELSKDVRALLPVEAEDSTLRFTVVVDRSERARRIDAKLFAEGDNEPRLRRSLSISPGECAAMPRFLSRMVRGHLEGAAP